MGTLVREAVGGCFYCLTVSVVHSVPVFLRSSERVPIPTYDLISFYDDAD
jgi:hypothetical protein